jgi:hypothetical protein
MKKSATGFMLALMLSGVAYGQPAPPPSPPLPRYYSGIAIDMGSVPGSPATN